MLPTPCYVAEEKKIKENLAILNKLEQDTGGHILLAQKAFAMHALYPLIGRYICGTTASGLFEARLGHEKMGKENHVFAPAYKGEDMEELVTICDHIVFNSWSQYQRHLAVIREKGGGQCSVGLRINPECSTVGA